MRVKVMKRYHRFQKIRPCLRLPAGMLSRTRWGETIMIMCLHGLIAGKTPLVKLKDSEYVRLLKEDDDHWLTLVCR
jgi:hypothetical protein